MLHLIKDIWSWLTNQALSQLLILLFVALLLLCINVKYPIEFERTSFKVKQNVDITETTKYIIQSSFSEKGAKLKLCTQSYIVEVNKIK